MTPEATPEVTPEVTPVAAEAEPDLSVEAALGYARDVLDGAVPMPRGRSTRAAAVLARQALEDALRARCRSAGFDLDKATMRSRLIVLRVLVDQAAADAADVAWAGLSRACHQHAYELTPTTTEVRHLLTRVAALLPLSDVGHTDPAAQPSVGVGTPNRSGRPVDVDGQR